MNKAGRLGAADVAARVARRASETNRGRHNSVSATTDPHASSVNATIVRNGHKAGVTIARNARREEPTIVRSVRRVADATIDRNVRKADVMIAHNVRRVDAMTAGTGRQCSVTEIEIADLGSVLRMTRSNRCRTRPCSATHLASADPSSHARVGTRSTWTARRAVATTMMRIAGQPEVAEARNGHNSAAIVRRADKAKARSAAANT